MTPAEYRATLARLGETQGGAARLLGVGARTSQRWALGERAVPPPVERLLWAIERDATMQVTLRGWKDGERYRSGRRHAILIHQRQPLRPHRMRHG